MRIWNDDEARSRIILLGLEAERDLPPFHVKTRQGAYLAEVVGRPMWGMFATACILETNDSRRAERAARDALPWLDGRRTIIVGKRACDLLDVDSSPMMTWRKCERRGCSFEAAPYPAPSQRSQFWADLQSAEQAMVWLVEQAEERGQWIEQ
jgi:hypothetical protein